MKKLLFIILLLISFFSTSAQAQGKRIPLYQACTHAVCSTLAHHWKLDELGTIRYASFGGQTLTDNNTVGSTAGKIGNAANFIAANVESLTAADTDALSFSGNFTFVVWVRLTTKAALWPLIAKAKTSVSGADDLEYQVIYNNASDRFEFYVGNDTAFAFAQASSFGSPSTATWYFIAVWYDATNLSISVNDGTTNTTAYTGNSFNANGPFVLGGRADAGLNLNGDLDQISLFTSDIGSSNRTYLYNSGNGRVFPYQ